MCLYRLLFEVPCPGCGMIRAFLHLYAGDIREAFHFHPLWPIIPLFLFLFLLSIKLKWAKRIINDDNTYSLVAILFLETYIIRMILMYPDIAPMKI
jgi:hypothetical protein